MKQMLVLRKDLKMQRGKEIAQGAHASLAATLENLDHPSVKEWLSGAFAKVAVGVETEEELLAIVEQAKEAGLITRTIVDSGRTQFNGVHTLTCAAIGPATNEQLQPITGHLGLR